MKTMAPHDRVIALCERLADATLYGDAAWRSDRHDLYVWENEHGSVTIGARDGDGQPPYELVVRNVNGDAVEELASSLLDGDLPAPWNEALAELYRIARRSGLHADELIDALIAALPARRADDWANGDRTAG